MSTFRGEVQCRHPASCVVRGGGRPRERVRDRSYVTFCVVGRGGAVAQRVDQNCFTIQTVINMCRRPRERVGDTGQVANRVVSWK